MCGRFCSAVEQQSAKPGGRLLVPVRCDHVATAACCYQRWCLRGLPFSIITSSWFEAPETSQDAVEKSDDGSIAGSDANRAYCKLTVSR